MNMKHGRLFLIPTILGDSPIASVLPANINEVIGGIRHFVVEDLRTSRRFLKKVDRNIDIDSLEFSILNEHTTPEEISTFLQPLLGGTDTGLMSEAGSPCVADPGSYLVSLAHEKGIRVVPLSGPSSTMRPMTPRSRQRWTSGCAVSPLTQSAAMALHG